MQNNIEYILILIVFVAIFEFICDKMLFLRVSAALLLCGYCAVSILADRAKCPDFNNIDFCDDEDNDFDLLQVSFGECNAIVTPHNARHEPVVKYNDAEEVYSCTSAIYRYIIYC